jgi:alpha-tubulin suppressor-like RCC1 family protein
LGDGTSGFGKMTNLPEQIVSSNVTVIAAGGNHSLFLKSNGSLWDMGYERYGQLGNGTYGTAPFYATNLPDQIVSSEVTAIAAGGSPLMTSPPSGHSLFLKSDGSLWVTGENYFGQLGDGTYNTTNRPEQIVAGTPGYNKIFVQLLSGGDVQLSYVGITGTNYALDLSVSLSPANWVPQVTNPAGVGGVLVLTNTPYTITNNFWRIRSVP